MKHELQPGFYVEQVNQNAWLKGLLAERGVDPNGLDFTQVFLVKPDGDVKYLTDPAFYAADEFEYDPAKVTPMTEQEIFDFMVSFAHGLLDTIKEGPTDGMAEVFGRVAEHMIEAFEEMV